MDYPSLVEKSGTGGKVQLEKIDNKRAVIIRSSDYRTVLANSRALKLSDITADTPGSTQWQDRSSARKQGAFWRSSRQRF